MTPGADEQPATRNQTPGAGDQPDTKETRHQVSGTGGEARDGAGAGERA